MTAYGPPSGPPAGPPSGPPPGSPPPPPTGGGYGPPSSYGSGPTGAGKFDPKSVNPLDWAVIGAALLALIFSFFAFYGYDPKGLAKTACSSQQASLNSIEKQLCGGDTASAWHGFFGWFGVLLLVIAALAVLTAIFAPQVSMPVSVRLLGSGVAALGVIFLVLSLFVIPDWPPIADLVTSDTAYDKLIDNSVGFSWYIVLVLGLVVVALSFLRFQQTGGALPGRSGAGTAAPAGYGQGQQSGGGFAPPTQQYPPERPPAQGPAQAPPQQQYPPEGPPAQGPPQGYGQQPSAGYTPPPQ